MMRACAGVLFCVSLAMRALPASPADALPTVDEIAAHVRAAAGEAPASYREVVDATGGGTTIHTVTIRSGRDYREDVDTGPLHAAHGSIGGQAWRQNENGETILVQADPGLAARDVFTGSVVAIASPVAGYLVSSLDVRGDGVKRYVDAATWRVVRTDVVRASGTTTTTFDDFRTVDGRTLAFHRHTSDGHPEDDEDARVSDYDAEPVDHNALAVPHARRTLVEFPAGTRVVQLPVRMIHGKFVVRVDVGGRGLDLILDTGAAGIVLEDGVVKQLGLTPLATRGNAANAGRFVQRTAVVPRMSVGDLTMRDVVVSSVPSVDEEDPLGAYRAVGLLGFDFIDGVALKLDYDHGTATAYDPTAFTPPDVANGFALDLRLGSEQPLTTVTVNGAVGERFLLDTGAFGSLMVFDYFVRRNPGAVVDEGGGARAQRVAIRGAGGVVDTTNVQLKDVQFGSVAFHDFTAIEPAARSAYDQNVDGIVGPTFLRLFDVYFDYTHARAYFLFNDAMKSTRG